MNLSTIFAISQKQPPANATPIGIPTLTPISRPEINI